MAEENKEWAPCTLKEAPYWRNGMTAEEYDLERDYFNAHLEEFYNGTYLPLWKQNK